MTGIHQALATGGGPIKSLMGLIGAAGLTSGLVYCLDAGDPSSYGGTGQDWSDLSGNGRTYQRGATSAVEGSDPIFNGVAGSLDETNYWSFDGGDSFTPVTSPTTFDDGWATHAGAVTVLNVFRAVSSVLRGFCGNQSGTVANGGLAISIDGSEKIRLDFNVNDVATGTNFTRITSSAAFTLNALQLCAVAFDGVDAAANFQINATQEVGTCSSAQLSGTNAPPQDWRIGTNGFSVLAPGDRLYATAVWSTKLSMANLSSLYSLLKANRFTSLP